MNRQKAGLYTVIRIALVLLGVLLIGRYGLGQVCQSVSHTRQDLVNRAIQRLKRGNGIAQAYAAWVVPAS